EALVAQRRRDRVDDRGLVVDDEDLAPAAVPVRLVHASHDATASCESAGKTILSTFLAAPKGPPTRPPHRGSRTRDDPVERKDPRHGKVKKVALGVAALSGAAVGGAAVAGAANSNSGTTTTPPTATAGRQPPAPPQNMPAHGSAAHEDAEEAVTGDDAAKAQ